MSVLYLRLVEGIRLVGQRMFQEKRFVPELFLAYLARVCLSLRVGVLVSDVLIVGSERQVTETADVLGKRRDLLMLSRVVRVIKRVGKVSVARFAGEKLVAVQEAVLQGHQVVGADKRAGAAGKLVKLWVRFFVSRESLVLIKALSTLRTHMHEPRPVLLGHVILDTCAISIPFFAQRASEWFAVIVAEHMSFEVVSSSKGLRALRAFVWPESGVEPHMTFQIILGGESPAAFGAAVQAVLGLDMHGHVCRVCEDV